MGHLLLNTHGLFEKVLTSTGSYLAQVHIENKC